MNFDHCGPQTYGSAPGGRHRHSEALPGHDVAAVASPPPAARHRLGAMAIACASPTFSLGNRALTPQREPAWTFRFVC